jgi:hypothetical protein
MYSAMPAKSWAAFLRGMERLDKIERLDKMERLAKISLASGLLGVEIVSVEKSAVGKARNECIYKLTDKHDDL